MFKLNTEPVGKIECTRCHWEGYASDMNKHYSSYAWKGQDGKKYGFSGYIYECPSCGHVITDEISRTEFENG